MLRDPVAHVFQSILSECMMSDAEHVEADALADSVFSSAEVGDRNLLAIRVLELTAKNERLERETDEREREIDRLRFEAGLALLRLRKLRVAIEEGATDAAQASAAEEAMRTIEEGSCSDLGPKAEPLASAFLAAHEELKMKRGLLVAVAEMIEAEKARGSR